MKYLLDGRAVEIMDDKTNSEGKILVADVCFVEGQTYTSDNLYYIGIDKVFDKPPTQVYDNKIKNLKDKILELEKIKSEKIKEISDIDKNNKNIIKNLKKHEALKHLEDVLEKRVTHFVDEYNNIHNLDDAKCEYDKKSFKVIGILQDSRGEISFNLSKYRDESGDWREVTFFKSCEEAENYVKNNIIEKFNIAFDITTSPWMLNDMNDAKVLNMVNQDKLKKYIDCLINDKKEIAQSKQNEISKLQQECDELNKLISEE